MTDLRRNFGRQHAKHRRAAGLTQEAMAMRMGFALKTVQMYEQGARTPPLAYAKGADEVLGLDDVLLNLAELCRADDSPFGSFLELERRADQIRAYSMLTVDGLLQTAEYARAVMEVTSQIDGEDVDEGVRLRLERQEILSRTHPPRLHVILDESVLYRPFGGHRVHAEQLARLLDLPKNIVVQVLPLEMKRHASPDGGLKILDFSDGEPSVFNVQSYGVSAIMDDPAAVKRAVATFEMLAAAAMSPENSAAMIRDVMEYYSDDDV